MKTIFRRVVFFLVSFFGATPFVHASLILDANNHLIGATDVAVGGTMYDVRFVRGRCADLFDGCTQFNDGSKPFDPWDAMKALGAMIEWDQKNSTSPAVFDGKQPFPTVDAPRTSFGGLRYLNIVHSFYATYPEDRQSFWVDNIVAGKYPEAIYEIRNYAVWSPTIASVPEPSSFGLLALGCAALILGRCRRQS